jgi:glycosyltransferase involved in cell wall biosynthesis
MTPIRLTAVLTHPVQYLAPWFRHVAAEPAIDLTVIYATVPLPEQQGVGFERAFTWDVDLTDGYRSRVLRPPRRRDHVGAARFFGLDAPAVGAAIAESRPHAALIPGWHATVLLRALIACRRLGVPAIYRGDSNLASSPGGWRRPLRALRTRLLLHLYSAWLAVGTRAREYLRRFGAAGELIFDSPHCVDGARFADAARAWQGEARGPARAAAGVGASDFAVLFVGKLEAKKRVADLVRAIARLGPGAMLVVAGAGAEEPRLRALAASCGARVAWLGFVNQGELGRAYAIADCLALPSDGRETWGLVVNEALACGLPAVVSDRVGCAPDLVAPAETGEVHPCGDVAALAAALERVRRLRDAGHDFAPAARARAATYSFAAATAGLVAACRQVTAAPADAPRRDRATR